MAFLANVILGFRGSSRTSMAGASVKKQKGLITLTTGRVLRGRRRGAGDGGKPQGPQRTHPRGQHHDAGIGTTTGENYNLHPEKWFSTHFLLF